MRSAASTIKCEEFCISAGQSGQSEKSDESEKSGQSDKSYKFRLAVQSIPPVRPVSQSGQNGTTRCVGINIYKSTVTRRLICELSSKIPDNYRENIIIRPDQESIVGFFLRKGMLFMINMSSLPLHPLSPSIPPSPSPVSLHPPQA